MKTKKELRKEIESLNKQQDRIFKENGYGSLEIQQSIYSIEQLLKGRQEALKEVEEIIDNMVDYGNVASEDDYGDIWLPIDLLKQKIKELEE